MIQWKDLEVITKHIEDDKPTVIVDLYHNPGVKPVIQLHERHDIDTDRVYLGSFLNYNANLDMSYQSKCLALQEELRHKTELIWKLKAKISELDEIF